jgi:prevent-host-death family protein
LYACRVFPDVAAEDSFRQVSTLLEIGKNVHYVHISQKRPPMAQWQTADAKQRFTELVEAANGDGPQVVMRHKDPVAVVLSPAEYRRLVRQADANFADLLGQSPFSPEDIQPVGMSLTSS